MPAHLGRHQTTIHRNANPPLGQMYQVVKELARVIRVGLRG